MRRPNHPEQYLGNTNTKEVHDLDKQVPGCRIDEIVRAGHDVYFATYTAAKAAGYDNCAHCLGSSRR